MKIKFLKAFNGDSILLSFLDGDGNNRNILMDGGTPRTYQRFLKPELNALIDKGECIDLLIVTHIDDDHIGGIKELYQDTHFKKDLIKSVWFNSGILLSDSFKEKRESLREVAIIMDDQTSMSVSQGVTLEKALIKEGNWIQKLIKIDYQPIKFYGTEITILSPSDIGLKKLHKKWEVETEDKVDMSGEHDDFASPIAELIKKPFKEDKSVPNGGSIAILIKSANCVALLLGDAYPSVVEETLKKLGYSAENKLVVDVIKVSHHASKGNTSPGLLSLIDCNSIVVCTNGSKYGLPDKEALARLIASNPDSNIYFNYDTFMDNLFTSEDSKQFKFKTHSLSQMHNTLNL